MSTYLLLPITLTSSCASSVRAVETQVAIQAPCNFIVYCKSKFLGPQSWCTLDYCCNQGISQPALQAAPMQPSLPCLKLAQDHTTNA